MSTKLLHQAAMALCDQIDAAQREGGHDEEAIEKILVMALDLEEVAARRTENQFDKAVLFRSAASIAAQTKGRRWRVNDLVFLGLQCKPPQEIRAELLEVKRRNRKAIEV